MNLNDKQFLLNTFPEFKGRTLKGQVLAHYYEAERLLNGWESIKRRNCSCNLAGMAREVDKQHEKWLSENEQSG